MKKILLALLSTILFAAPASAQDVVLTPAGTWMVGPTMLEDGVTETAGIPCVMVNKFSNNVEMRLSGGGEDILAMALSVDGKPFTKDQSYLISIGFTAAAAAKYPAQAFAENTLVVGLAPGKDFYKSLQTATSLFVTLGTEVMEFSLLGVSQSLKRLESCYQPAVRAQPAPARAEPAEIPGIHKLDDSEAKHAGDLIDKATGNALPPMAVPAQQNAVAPRDILPTTNSTADSEQKRWRVMKGGELYGVLKIWADSAKARVVWKADRAFIVPESMVMQGTFENAVEGLLLHFPSGQPRPVGKIYNDPVTLQKTLQIDVETSPEPQATEGNYAPIGAQ